MENKYNYIFVRFLSRDSELRKVLISLKDESFAMTYYYLKIVKLKTSSFRHKVQHYTNQIAKDTNSSIQEISRIPQPGVQSEQVSTTVLLRHRTPTCPLLPTCLIPPTRPLPPTCPLPPTRPLPPTCPLPPTRPLPPTPPASPYVPTSP